MPKKGTGKCIDWIKAHVAYKGDDCLPWPFAKDNRIGRGQLGWNGTRYWAHRLMCMFAHGDPPTPKHQATHTCGKGHYGCCNPMHLEWATNSKNQLDRWRKNGSRLHNRGGQRGILTPAQQAQIVALKGKKTQVAIAKQFGVSLGCVQWWHKVRDQRRNAA